MLNLLSNGISTQTMLNVVNEQENNEIINQPVKNGIEGTPCYLSVQAGKPRMMGLSEIYFEIILTLVQYQTCFLLFRRDIYSSFLVILICLNGKVMQIPYILTIIVFALSLAIQIINLAAGGMQSDVYRNLGVRQSHQGYYAFVLTATCLSILGYIYILIVKIRERTPSVMADWIIIHTVLILQFAIAVVLGVYLHNTYEEYKSYMMALDNYHNLGIQNETTHTLERLRDTRALSIAACVLDFLFCYLASFIITAWHASKVPVASVINNNPQRAHNTSEMKIGAAH